MNFEGIYTPLITPYRADGDIDYDALVALVENLVQAGVDGVVSGGSTGEYYAQSIDERVKLAELTKAVVGNRAKVIVGTGAIQLRDSIAMAEAAAKICVDAILVGSPPYAVPTEKENAANALAIDRAANLPIMLYNYPGRMCVTMGEEFLDRVCRSRNFQGIKESSGDINRLHLLAREYAHIQLCCGMDDQALEYFAWGAKGWVCGGSNFLAKEHLALYRACVQKGDFQKGRRIMSALLPLMRVLEQGGKFIQCIKYGVDLSGGYGGLPRAPLSGLTTEEKRTLEQVVGVLKRTICEVEKDAGNE